VKCVPFGPDDEDEEYTSVPVEIAVRRAHLMEEVKEAQEDRASLPASCLQGLEVMCGRLCFTELLSTWHAPLSLPHSYDPLKFIFCFVLSTYVQNARSDVVCVRKGCSMSLQHKQAKRLVGAVAEADIILYAA
jgi:hypothetical protein